MVSVNIALAQLRVSDSKTSNFKRAREMVLEASHRGAQIVVLPESFYTPMGSSDCAAYAELIDGKQLGEAAQALSDMAKAAKVFLVGGSIYEKSAQGPAIFNTCTVWNPEGELILKHRKVHPYAQYHDGHLTGEVDAITAGRDISEFATPWGKFGVAVCNDVRYAEMAMVSARNGCVGMIYAAAHPAGRWAAHWEILLRARALDNLVFVAGCNPAKDTNAGFVPCGQSMVVSPVAETVAAAGDGEELVIAEMDLDLIQAARNEFPLYRQRRFDVYRDVTAAN
ncbi:Nit protein 2 [Linderina pennispora]|uniref:Nit protein 2 n=1 Tax=Linderina pennispora TaxID=61395 RepID=A0A1Y1W9N9_9FUNG|nr:Nit protein 2 [Linderina pennispora]ORX70233.1 Nit protein 2 [Linderina pennispora]